MYDMFTQPLDVVPLWLLYPLTVLLLLGAVAAGSRYVEGKQRKAPIKSDAGVGAISGATLALLAFLLAFVVGFGVNLTQERRGLVVAEANAIGTTWLRAGYLDEPYRTESRDLLREYVDQRLAALNPGKLAAAIARSEEIHQELWALVEELVTGGSATPTTGLYVSSLNEVIDLHTERVVTGIYIRIPPSVLLGMYLIALVAMFLVGMQAGYAERRNVVSLVLLVLVLSFVLYLIVDLDRSQQGMIQVPQQALFDLQEQLSASP